MNKRIIRVFPRRTKATPIDELVRVYETPSLFDEADEVHMGHSVGRMGRPSMGACRAGQGRRPGT